MKARAKKGILNQRPPTINMNLVKMPGVRGETEKEKST